MEFDSESCDFGTVFQMREYEGSFKLRNSGTADLIIEKVSATCGCTAVLLSDERVEPGGKAEIKVTFKSGMYSRAVRKIVRVQSNDPDTPRKKLYVKATVVPRVVLEPKLKLLRFKEVHNKKGAVQSISVKPSDTEDIRSLKVGFTSGDFRGKIERVSVVESEFRVEVSVPKGLPIGRVAGWMRFYINGESEPCAKLHVSAKIIGDITVSPTRLVFRTKLGSDDEIKPITLTNIASEPLEILSVECDVAGLEVEASPVEKGKSYTIVSRLAPDVQPGMMNGNITIRTNNADQSEITIPVHATVE